MKPFLKICFTFIFVWLSLASKASNNPTIIIKHPEKKKFSLLLHQLDREAYTVQLRDQAGRRLFKKNITNVDSFGKVYDLKNLPNGEYTLSVENQQKILIQTITIEASTLKIATGKWETSFKPYFAKAYSHVDMTFLQLENTATFVEIINESAEVIHQERIEEVGSICKRFNLDLLAPGDYTFVVSVQDQVYQKTISIKNLMAFQCIR